MPESGPASGEVVLVTGSGSGLGLETALTLASRGFQVYGSVLTAEEDSALQTMAASRGVSITSLPMDVTREDQVHDAVGLLLSRAGRIDALVCFAGLGLRGFFEDLTLEEIRRVFDVNVFGTMTVTKAVLPAMREARRGRIILTSSAGGRMGSMTISGYASSKFAVEGFGECLYQEAYPLGIKVSILEPGLVATPHFTVNRNRARNAVNPASPYYAWFCQHEHIVDGILEKNRFGPPEVAETVYRILQAKRPRLRYVVGRPAKLIFACRRYIPGELFQNIYWAIVRKMVTRPKHPASQLRGASPAAPSDGNPRTDAWSSRPDQ
jgi:NAD(P)-dependent dehydrogenase (short-subunit alcohol dehydrogenase family)